MLERFHYDYVVRSNNSLILLSNSKIFKEKHGVHVAKMPIMDVMDDMMPSNFLSENSKVCHIRVGKMVVKHKRALLMFLILCKE